MQWLKTINRVSHNFCWSGVWELLSWWSGLGSPVRRQSGCWVGLPQASSLHFLGLLQWHSGSSHGSHMGSREHHIWCCSVTHSCLTLWPHGRQHIRPLCPSPSPGACWLKLVSIELVVLSNHLVLRHPLFLLPSIFPSIREKLNIHHI